MSLFVRNQINLRVTSSRATVPDNDLAKVMYYLNCVLSAIEYKEQDLSRYRDYQKWYQLSNEEKRLVWLLALSLSPDEFIEKVFFHSDALCGDSSNKFYEISQVSNQLAVVQSILIAGQSRRVTKIMTYKISWMQNNYYEPMRRLASQLSPQARRPTTSQTPRNNNVSRSDAACTIL